MAFEDITIENFFPSYLSPDTKDRLKSGLKSFFYAGANEREKNYSGFYALGAPGYLMQADVLHSVRTIDWDFEQNDYVGCFFPSILVSNTCDVTSENIRTTNTKQAMLAPIIPLEEYLKDLREEFNTDQVGAFYNALKRQEHSNLFYLPPNHRNGKEYIAFLDKIYWHPINALMPVLNDLNDQRYLSLSNWGFYLFLLKLSYHLCRPPEAEDGRQN